MKDYKRENPAVGAYTIYSAKRKFIIVNALFYNIFIFINRLTAKFPNSGMLRKSTKSNMEDLSMPLLCLS